MSTAEKFREYAADCMQKASSAQNPEEKSLHLNMAMAWVRLARQSEGIGTLLDQAEEQAHELGLPQDGGGGAPGR